MTRNRLKPILMLLIFNWSQGALAQWQYLQRGVGLVEAAAARDGRVCPRNHSQSLPAVFQVGGGHPIDFGKVSPTEHDGRMSWMKSYGDGGAAAERYIAEHGKAPEMGRAYLEKLRNQYPDARGNVLTFRGSDLSSQHYEGAIGGPVGYLEPGSKAWGISPVPEQTPNGPFHYLDGAHSEIGQGHPLRGKIDEKQIIERLRKMSDAGESFGSSGSTGPKEMPEWRRQAMPRTAGELTRDVAKTAGNLGLKAAKAGVSLGVGAVGGYVGDELGRNLAARAGCNSEAAKELAGLGGDLAGTTAATTVLTGTVAGTGVGIPLAMSAKAITLADEYDETAGKLAKLPIRESKGSNFEKGQLDLYEQSDPTNRKFWSNVINYWGW